MPKVWILFRLSFTTRGGGGFTRPVARGVPRAGHGEGSTDEEVFDEGPHTHISKLQCVIVVRLRLVAQYLVQMGERRYTIELWWKVVRAVLGNAYTYIPV